MLSIVLLPWLLAQVTAATPAWDVDRSSSGALWSTDGQNLYRLSAGAEHWERLAATRLTNLRALSRVGARAEDGTRKESTEGVLLWAGRTTRLWRDDGAGRSTVPGLSGIWISGISRREGLWLAYGSTRDDDLIAKSNGGTVVIDHSVATGPGFTAVVAASIDGGATWKVLDRSPGGQVEALYLADDGVLSLYIAGGGFRRGHLEQNEEGLALTDMRTLVELSATDRSGLKGLDRKPWIYFPPGPEGWMGGKSYYRGTRAFHTRNGGRTWSRVGAVADQSTSHDMLTWPDSGDLPSHPTLDGVLSDGRRVKTTRLEHLWAGREGERFRSLRKFPTRISWARVDGVGNLLVQLSEGGLFLYRCGEDSWTNLGAVGVGR